MAPTADGSAPKKKGTPATAPAKKKAATASAPPKAATAKSSSGAAAKKAAPSAAAGKPKLKPKAEAKPGAAADGTLERVLEPDADDAMKRAEGGEVSSQTILDALARQGEDPPEEAAEAPAAELAGLLIGPVGDDPWGAYERDQEWDAVEEEKATKVVVEPPDFIAGGRGLAVGVETKIRQSVGGEGTHGVALVATDSNQDAFPMARPLPQQSGDLDVHATESDYTRSVLVQLDLTNSKLTSIKSIVANGFLWLRELKLTGSKLKGWPQGLEALPALLSLDLSFNPGIRLAGAALTPLAGLWRLDIAGCGMESLTGTIAPPENGYCLTPQALAELQSYLEDEDEGEDDEVDEKPTPLAACTALTDLNLSDNEFRRVGALHPLKQLGQLRALDLQDNEELCENSRVKKEILAMLPKLLKFNGVFCAQWISDKPPSSPRFARF